MGRLGPNRVPDYNLVQEFNNLGVIIMDNITKLMTSDRPFLTDGGFETWMFFVEGFEAPEFAALVLMEEDAAREKMKEYFARFFIMAEQADTGFILDTNTWRGCTSWAPALGVSEDKILDLSRNAVDFAQELRTSWAGRVNPIIVNGVVGPAGDGYNASDAPDASQAEALHMSQISVLAESGVDMISAITINNSAEAIGIARAADEQNLPSVISFTVETDGRLPSGELLGDAIGRTDAATDNAPIYYMVNCAHPDHFKDALLTDEAWLERIGGVRANASRMSHEELDQSETLDDGDPQEFGDLHAELATMLPNLRAVGGCCGTDHRHVGCVSNHLYQKTAA